MTFSKLTMVQISESSYLSPPHLPRLYILLKKYNLMIKCVKSQQDILSVAQSRLSAASSAAVCRKLSSVGRRVLSIESVSAFQGHFCLFNLHMSLFGVGCVFRWN